MDLTDHIRAREAEDVVRAFQRNSVVREAIAVEVRFLQTSTLDHGAHRTVENEDPLRQLLVEGPDAVPSGTDGGGDVHQNPPNKKAPRDGARRNRQIATWA